MNNSILTTKKQQLWKSELSFQRITSKKMSNVENIEIGEKNEIHQFLTIMSISVLKRKFEEKDILTIDVDKLKDEKTLSLFNNEIAGIASIAIECDKENSTSDHD